MIDSAATWRARWAAVGAAVAVSLGAGGLLTASAAPSTDPGSYIPITPCRVMDTRPGGDNVGSRSTPLGPNETHTIAVRGTNGNCTIPAGAISVVMNVAAVFPSAASFLTVFPADVARPLASSLNWPLNSPPISNAVTASLSADGRISFYNLFGTVHVTADIVGYYLPAHAEVVVSGGIPATGSLNAQVTFTTSAETVTTTTSGRWLVTKAHNGAAFCANGAGVQRYYFLMIDGVPVPSSRILAETGATLHTTFTGMTTNAIAAGAHTVAVGAMCLAGAANGTDGATPESVVGVTVLP
jgi:hypothetical protein